MSLHHNPRIVTDGLVFAYDMDNAAKSFKGKPTTNYINVNGYTTQSSPQNVSDLPNLREISSLVGGYSNIKYPVRQTTATNWLDLYMCSGSITLQPGESLVASCYVYTDKSDNYFNGNGNFGATLGTNAGFLSGATDITPGTWTRLVGIKENTTGSAISVVSSRIETGNVTNWSGGHDAWAVCPQWEVATFATPFVDGTRSNTQALLDMSKSKNTVTATSLTYNADGTFSFNGSSNYMIPNTNCMPVGSSFSLDVWAKVNTVSASSIVEFKNSSSGRTLNVHLPWVDNNVYFDSGAADGSSSYDRIVYATSAVDRTGWHNWCFVKDIETSTMYIYLDSELKQTGTSKSIVPGTTTSASIGSYASGSSNFFNGELPVLKIHNRALTAAEIRQNFHATRGRFGI